ncbi:hypothetical protein LY90DRAFT_671522 [Neocallimastix californiae]|uniref:G-protein coupled receptors family 3 profile domain-containing protein n=1 Tax=Neocallimastix californiae TaxID=1754190 RepID=A0A1Y2CEA7_9FUNG|nr:hypothetical protein LY90DRAFT_671522 [Neocallimastix californiae]|eukprot:ORY45400.1 hypothetical protein LY90DRAFT_671522 [Neocallimastix californiae]
MADLNHIKGKNFKSYNNEGTLFMLNVGCNIEITDFIFEDAWCKSKGNSAFLYHTIENLSDQGEFHIRNCNVKNILMNTDFDMRLIGWNKKGLLLFLRYIRSFHWFIYSLDHKLENNEKNFLELENGVGKYGLITMTSSLNELTIKNTKFENFNKEFGIKVSKESPIKIENSYFNNSFFTRGLFSLNYFVDDSLSSTGNYTILGTTFENIYGIKGSVFDIEGYDYHNFSYNITNCIFKNNYSKYGGVIYSINDDSSKSINFTNCEFINNRSPLGNIVYSSNIKSIPNFSNIEELYEIEGAIVTNPTIIKKMNTTDDILKVYSGNTITDVIHCNIYDDFGKRINFHNNMNEVEESLSKMPFYNIKINDTDNAIIFGSKVNYCYYESCPLQKIRVVGNPGIYKITFILETFGKFMKFKNNTDTFEIEILPCPSEFNEVTDEKNNTIYINQDIESVNIKSCYIPTCNPKCANNGKCVNINVCDCDKTKFIGLHCNEYKQMKSIIGMDILIFILSIVLIISSIILMIVISVKKDNKLIKGGGFEFLIIILIGTILSYCYSMLSVIKKTEILCYATSILKNLFFVNFATILIKILRIYYIYYHRRHIVIPRFLMYIFIFSISLFHIFISLIELMKNDKLLKIKINDRNEQYEECVYSKIHDLSYIVNISIIIIGGIVTYLNRKLDKVFNEV